MDAPVIFRVLISKQQIFETVAPWQRQHDNGLNLVIRHHHSRSVFTYMPTEIRIVPSMQSLRQLHPRVCCRLQQLGREAERRARMRRHFPRRHIALLTLALATPGNFGECCFCMLQTLRQQAIRQSTYRSTSLYLWISCYPVRI